MEASDPTRWLELLAESEERLDELDDSADPVAQRQIIEALSSKWRALRKLERLPEAIEVSEDLVRKLTDEPTESKRTLALRVLSLKAVDLAELGETARVSDTADAMLLLSESVERTELVSKLTLAALLLKAQAAGSDNGALATVDAEIISRFGDSDDPLIREHVSAALLRRALRALRDSRVEDAIQMGLSFAERLDDAPDEKLAAEADLVILYARALSGWCMFRPGWRGRSEWAAFVIANVITRARALSLERLSRSRLGSVRRLPTRTSHAHSDITQARWTQWRRRLETALELHERVIGRIGDSEDPESQRSMSMARMQLASVRTVLGRVKQGTREMERIVESYHPETVQALQAMAADLRGKSNLSAQIGELSALSLRARALGEGDTRIQRIAYDDSIKPIMDETSHRSVRWMGRLLRPEEERERSLTTRTSALLRALRRRRGPGERPA